MKSLVSKRTLQTVREYFVSTSLHVIEMEFDAADIAVDLEYSPPVNGQRRTLVEQYYHTLDWTKPADVQKFLTVVAGIVDELNALEQAAFTADYAVSERARIIAALAGDRWEWDGHYFVSKIPSHLGDIANSAAKLDAPELHRQLERLTACVETDPALALGTAKELVETACKTILEERDRPIDPEWDIGRLVKETREVLHLLPSDIPDAAKGASSIKRLLSNLGAVVQGLGELRNLYGTGHGRTARRAIEPRHARLTSGAAAALVTFLLETHWQRGD